MILNVKFNAFTWNFLSLVILSAIFNVSVLDFSMYVDLYLFIIYLFISKTKRNAESITIEWKSNCKTKKNTVSRLLGTLIAIIIWLSPFSPCDWSICGP